MRHGMRRLLAIAALAILLASPALAQPRRFGPPEPGGMAIGSGQLTEQQREALQKLRESAPDQRATLEKVRNLENQLQDALFADTPDTAKIEALRKEIASIQGSILTTQVNRQLQLAKILTPEQRKLFRERRGGRMGLRGPGGFVRPGPMGGRRFVGPRGGRGFKGPRGFRGGRAFRGPRGPRGPRGFGGPGFWGPGFQGPGGFRGPRWMRPDEEEPR